MVWPCHHRHPCLGWGGANENPPAHFVPRTHAHGNMVKERLRNLFFLILDILVIQVGSDEAHTTVDIYVWSGKRYGDAQLVGWLVG